MTYKRILTIQDISCVGQCSMTMALPILSACGHETCILPTALLSTHTGGFGTPAVHSLTDSMAEILAHWKRQNFVFDAIYTGYLGSTAAICETEKIADTMLSPGGKLIVDPAMADHGKLYSGFDASYAEAMKQFCRKADMILPNITEAAMFAGLPYRENLTGEYIDSLINGLNHPCVILTGVGLTEDETGTAVLDHGKRYDYYHKKMKKSYHGTGDMFASCFAGAYLQGFSLSEAASLAADMVLLSIENTEKNPAHWYGVKFETAIPELVRRLHQK